MANTLTLTTASGQTLARHNISQSPLRIQAVDNVYYQLSDDNGLAIQNVQAGRAGNDLIISIPGEAPITVENYFLFDDTGLKNPLLGLHSNGQYIAYPIADSAPIAPAHQLAEEITVSSTANTAIPPAAIVAGVLGIGAAGIALASGNNNNDNPAVPQQPQTPFDPNNNSPTPTPNPTPTPTPTPNPNPNPNPNPTPNQAPTDIALSANNIMEGKAGAVVGQLTTTDPDANDTHTYTVSDNRFEVINGELKLKSGQVLNFSNEPTITLNITSTDSGSLSTSKNFTLQVQDDPNYPAPPPPGNRAPTDIALSANSIMEGKAGASVGQLTTTDPDANDSHTYTVSDNRFEVVNGELKLKAGEILNFTNEPSISLTITSTDSGNLSTSKAFTLQVQDDPNYPAPPPSNQAPTDIALSANTIAEGKDGAVVGQLTTTDPDTNDSHTYTVSDNRFEVVSGELKLKAGEILNFTHEPSISLTITSTDAGNLSTSKTFTLNVQDDLNYPAPQPPGKLGVYVPAPTTDFIANVKDYGAKGDGQADDTAAIQNAINAIAAQGGGIVDIPAGTYRVNALNGGIFLRSNVTVRMTDDTVVQAIANDATSYTIFRLQDIENAHILGGTLLGERDEHLGTTGQGGFGVLIFSSRNVVIEKVTANKFWGDGFIVGRYYADQPDPENIIFYQVSADNNRRQGLSITNGSKIKVIDSVFANTDGQSPQSGIDIEPNPSAHSPIILPDGTRVAGVVSDVEISGSRFLNNSGYGVIASANGDATVKNIVLRDNEMTGNHHAITFNGVQGGSITGNSTLDSGRTIPYFDIDIFRSNDIEVRDNVLHGGRVRTYEDNNLQGTGHVVSNNALKAAVFIKGALVSGETVYAQVEDGNGYRSAEVRYQWYADGQAINGAQEKSYTIQASDAGKGLSVAVQFTDNAGQAESARSQSLPAVNSLTHNQAPQAITLANHTVIEGKAGASVGRLSTTDSDRGDDHVYQVNDARFEVDAYGQLKLKPGELLNYAQEPSIALSITSKDRGGATVTQDFTLNVEDDPAYTAAPPAPPATQGKESGLMLDIARHFYQAETIKHFIDDIAAAGGTFLHLHTSDTENYALESALLGQTTANATQRGDGVYLNNHNGKPFLSNAQIAEIVAHAKSKGIELIPEVDAPAHMKGIYDLVVSKEGVAAAQALFDTSQDADYPELRFSEDKAVAFVQSLYSEVITAFSGSGKHFHIGGDEFSIAADENALFVSYANQMAEFLRGKGLGMRMWNDGALKTSLATLDSSIDITYWSLDGNRPSSTESQWNRDHRASVQELLAHGIDVLNYNDVYLYHNPAEYDIPAQGVEKSSDTSLFSRNDGQKILAQWHLGLWDENNTGNAVDPILLKGAALSIWGEHAGNMDGESIRLFTQSRLNALIEKTNAAADPSGQQGAALEALQDSDFAILDQPFYVDFTYIDSGSIVDLSGGGKDTLKLLHEDVLDTRGTLEIRIHGGLQSGAAESQRDVVELDGSKWQKSGADAQYEHYHYADTRLLIENDIVITII